jgi:hypothetical protein
MLTTIGARRLLTLFMLKYAAVYGMSQSQTPHLTNATLSGTSTTLLVQGYLSQAEGSHSICLPSNSISLDFKLSSLLSPYASHSPPLFFLRSQLYRPARSCRAFPLPNCAEMRPENRFIFNLIVISPQVAIIYLVTYGFWILPDTGSGMLGQSQKVCAHAASTFFA